MFINRTSMLWPNNDSTEYAPSISAMGSCESGFDAVESGVPISPDARRIHRPIANASYRGDAGLEGAKAILDHETMNTTDIYASRDLEVAKGVVRRIA
jgi:hypothetical protein